MPVLHQVCKNCGLTSAQHVDGKCLFQASDYAPGKITTMRKTIKAKVVACGRCGDTKNDPEHEGPCGECAWPL